MDNYSMTPKQTTYVFVTLMNPKATSSKIIKNNNVFFPSHSVAYNRAFHVINDQFEDIFGT